MRKLLLVYVFATVAVAASPVFAADAKVRSAQEKLSALGFYTGTADGELNSDTRGALRRFQIYKGLNASGDLDPQTQTALAQAENGENKETGDVLTSVPSPSTQESDQEFLKRDQPRTPPAPPAPQPSQRVELTGEEARFFSQWYRDTPYQNAPPEVQSATLSKARAMLRERGLYEGSDTPLPGPEMEEALFRYQSSRRLRLTGRLDLETLAALRLLPEHDREQAPGLTAPSLKPFIDSAPATTGGAVRGIPLD